MQRCLSILLAGAAIMAVAIVYALIFGNFWDEAETMFPLPWFQLAMLDLYIGFFVFGGWVLYREPSRGVAVGWIVVFCLLGNLATCLYAARALVKARGDWTRFWMGHHAPAGTPA